jgi:hypothetical protein
LVETGYYQGAEQFLFAGAVNFTSDTLKGKHYLLFTALGRLFVLKKGFCGGFTVKHTAHACGVQTIRRAAGALTVEFKPTAGGFTLQVYLITTTTSHVRSIAWVLLFCVPLHTTSCTCA